MLRSYSHIGTGNYNPKTSRIYEDFGLFTVDDQVGRDLTRLFNELVRLRDREEVQAPARRPAAPAQGPAAAHRQGAPQRPRAASRPASASRSTPWSTSRSSTRSTGPARRACPSTCGCAASARSSPASTGMSENITGAQHPGPLSRALPHLHVRERRRPAGVHRQRRHDAPQPRPPRRGPRARRGARRT